MDMLETIKGCRSVRKYTEQQVPRSFLALGYCDGPYPQAKPRREGRVRIVEG